MKKRVQNAFELFPSLWLILGTMLVVASQTRFSIGALVWLMPIPFIHYLRKVSTVKARLLFLSVMAVAWSLAFLKILTQPLSPALAPLFGLRVALFHGIPYILADISRRRMKDGVPAAAMFAALLTVSEWVMHTFTPFASWGAAAYTQLESLTMLQFVSLAGIGGLAFVIYFTSAALEQLLTLGWHRTRRGCIIALSMIAVVIVYGSIRLAVSSEERVDTVLLGAVESDLHIKPNSGMPSEPALHRVEDALRERTSRAAAAGARLVTWSEAALLVNPDKEDAFIERTRELASAYHIHLVAAYVVPLSLSPLKFENKYIWIRPDGTLDHTYFKHEPVPGEPAVKGVGPMPMVETDWARMSGAICYDYDFPALAMKQARMGVDLVVNPSNDWRGIDPIHAQMAMVRGIEGGHSILRAAGSGLSIGSDPYGRVRGWMSSFQVDDRLLLVRLPVQNVTTVYEMLGDWIIGLSVIFLLAGLFKALRGLKKRG